jgi:hypothetical protein
MHPVVTRLFALDDALVARRFPAMTPWWRETITAFYESGRKRCVLRVGRRGGKSSTLCRVAVCEALYGKHDVPPGDIGVVAILSVDRKEAARRVRTISEILDAIGEPYKPIDGGIELTQRRVAVQVMTASLQGVVGFTAICVICDEVARWRDAETGANPATEVLASLGPTRAGQANAKEFLSSAPLGTIDAHAQAFDRGTDESQFVAYAPTWIARPSLTEAETHQLETDPKIWRREYMAIPSDTISIALDPDDVRAALRPCRPGVPLSAPVVIFDGSMGRGDSAAFGCAIWWQPMQGEDEEWETRIDPEDGQTIYVHDAAGNRVRKVAGPELRPELLLYNLGAITGRFADQGITSDDVVATVANLAHRFGARHVIADQHQSFALASAFARHSLALLVQQWTVESKGEALLRLRTLLRDRQLVIEPGPEGEALVKELLNLQETIRPSGSIGLGARRGHDDRAAAVLSLCMADSVGMLGGSPAEPQSGGLIIDSPIRGRSYHGGAQPPL